LTITGDEVTSRWKYCKKAKAADFIVWASTVVPFSRGAKENKKCQ
jgi:hypothetical protein